jgi:hypothetical protein
MCADNKFVKAIYRNFIITCLLSGVIGCGATYLVASSQSGYTAGYIILPLFLLFGIATLILLVSGFVCLGLKKKIAPWLLLSSILLPTSFISSALIAKYFEVGAYRQEPMVNMLDEISNVVVFKEETNSEQIENFWQTVMSSERNDGRGFSTLPGIRTITRLQSQNEREALAFSFFPDTTENQRQFVFAKIKSSPIVDQLLESQSMKEFNEKSGISPNKTAKEFTVTNSSSSK